VPPNEKEGRGSMANSVGEQKELQKLIAQPKKGGKREAASYRAKKGKKKK